jgi:hypothetical protein
MKASKKNEKGSLVEKIINTVKNGKFKKILT